MSLVSMQGCPHPPTPHPPRRSPWALLERHATDYTPLATDRAAGQVAALHRGVGHGCRLSNAHWVQPHRHALVHPSTS